MVKDAPSQKPIGSFGVFIGSVEILKVPFPGRIFTCRLSVSQTERIQIFDSKGSAFGYLDNDVKRTIESIAAQSSEFQVKITGIFQTDTPEQLPGQASSGSFNVLILFRLRATVTQIHSLPRANDFLFLDVLHSLNALPDSIKFEESK